MAFIFVQILKKHQHIYSKNMLMFSFIYQQKKFIPSASGNQ